ncbi:SAV_6107 family HEPN domain-containing protein [Corynebacterium mendelii]|uniref:SAV-6107-like HEPN domain-containing protein n=1 Tax=Corynebacterium mendelii TaxID=2765362 RepID=A0A939DYB5_9CORY|nr:SAV_6107 family HEPN domain-containing protein [Corynebacterium mendelii]MBN9643091.1 hypothetical protein [Corynebacterium mendelii]
MTVGTASVRSAMLDARGEFLAKANALLALSRRQLRSGDVDDAFESAYRAGLRTAGARVASSDVALKRRQPSCAWEKLARVDAEGRRQAAEFSRWMPVREKVITGLASVDRDLAEELMAQVELFITEVEREAAWLPAAA